MKYSALFVVATCLAVGVSCTDAADPPALRFYLPPSDWDVLDWRGNATDAQRELRRKQADNLFARGKQAADAGDCSTAARFAYETLHANPEHAAARKLLGYKQADDDWSDDYWVTDYQAAKHRGGSVWHAQFGWLGQDQVARYENGERFLNGRWVSAAADAAFRKTIDQGWKVDTEHFRLTTNVSLEEGVRLAGRLESLFHVWRQLFARFHTHEKIWKQLYAGDDPPKVKPQLFKVVYFRSKDEYVAALKRREPRIEMTSGIFLNSDDTAYFYADAKANNEAFLFHEVVHQLFMLSKIGSPRVGERGNFWIVEGAACYFESLALHDNHAELGGLKNARIAAARHRRLVDDFYVPLAEFTTFSMTTFQRDERLPRLYSQASGLSWFLLQADDGRYREATADYLSAVYAGKDTPTTLAERTGRTYADLDRDYLEYLKSLP